MTGAIADGWLGTSFTPDAADAHLAHLRRGAEKAGRKLGDISLCVDAAVAITESPGACLRIPLVVRAETRSAQGFQESCDRLVVPVGRLIDDAGMLEIARTMDFKTTAIVSLSRSVANSCPNTTMSAGSLSHMGVGRCHRPFPAHISGPQGKTGGRAGGRQRSTGC